MHDLKDRERQTKKIIKTYFIIVLIMFSSAAIAITVFGFIKPVLTFVNILVVIFALVSAVAIIKAGNIEAEDFYFKEE